MRRLLPAILFAITALRGAAEEPSSHARLEGRVVDESGAPVAEATVFAPAEPVVRTVTSADGRFSLRAPDSGRAASLYAQKQGFAIGFAPPRVWHDGDEIRDFVITLPKGYPLQVRVVDERRRPLPGVRVVVERTDIRMFRASIGSDDPGCPTCRSTDDDGIVNYRITDGDYRFAVWDREDKRPGRIVGPVALTAQSTPFVIELPATAAARPADAPVGSIAGRVIDRLTGKPVREFQVTLAYGPIWKLQQPFSAADGAFTLEASPGEVTVRVTAPGYLTSSTDVVVEERRPAGVEVALSRGGRISGRVTSNKQPVSLVVVSLAGSRADVSVDAVATDEEGTFVLEGVPPGEWTVELKKEGFVPMRRAVVLRGEEVHVDLDLDRGKELRGRVVDRRGTGISGVEIVAQSKADGAAIVLGRSGVDGWFSIGGLAPARYTVTARKDGVISSTAESDVPAAQPLVIAVDKGLSLTGRVTGIEPDALSGLRIVMSSHGTDSDAKIDGMGNFTIDGVPEGEVRLIAKLQRDGAERRVEKTVVMRPGLPPVELNLAEGVVIRGKVTRRGVPLREATITFYVDGDNSSRYTFGYVRDGLYEVALPSAGRYVVVIEVDNGLVLRHASKMEVAESGTRDVDIRGAELRGRVVDAQSGAPLAGARVTFTAKVVTGTSRTATTDADGRFVISDVTESTGSLHAQLDPYLPAVLAIDALPGGDVELRLGQGSEVRFVVVDAATGDLVRGAFVSVGSELNSRGVGLLPAGAYTAYVGATGYVAQWLPFNVPSGEVRVALVKAQ